MSETANPINYSHQLCPNITAGLRLCALLSGHSGACESSPLLRGAPMEVLPTATPSVPSDSARLDWLEDSFGIALVSDDKGHWAISGDGVQNITCDDDCFDMVAHFFVEKKFWRDSVREAIDVAMEDEDNIAPAPEEEGDE